MDRRSLPVVQGVEGDTKTCPQCGQVLFADMEVCYGCLYDFARKDRAPTGSSLAALALPESPLDLDEAAGAGDVGWEGHVAAEAALPSDGGMAEPEPECGYEPVTCLITEVGEEPTSSRGDGDAALDRSCPFALWVQTHDVDTVVPLGEGGVAIGRLPDNDVVLHSRAVSRHHVRVTPTASGALVEDLGATNPMLFMGDEAPERLSLGLGDTIDICGALFTLVERAGGRCPDGNRRACSA